MNPTLTALLTAAGPLLVQATPLLIAPLASLLVAAAERAPAVPYEGRTKAGIVAALLVAALVVRVALAWVTGTLAAVDWQAELTIVLDALKAAGIAAGGYAIARSSKPALPGGEAPMS